jgi:hypothetical protein
LYRRIFHEDVDKRTQFSALIDLPPGLDLGLEHLLAAKVSALAGRKTFA